MISNRLPKCFLAALPLFLLISCSSPSTPPAATTQYKKAQLCTDLANFKTSVATLRSMSPSSTVGDFKAARDQVKTEPFTRLEILTMSFRSRAYLSRLCLR